MCWALAVPLPCWMETTASSGWGHCLCFSEPDLHKSPEHHGYRKLDSLYRCPWTSLNWCGQTSFSGFSCPSWRNYHTSCLPLSAWQWLLPVGSIPFPLQWKWAGVLSKHVQYKFWRKPCSSWLKGVYPWEQLTARAEGIITGDRRALTTAQDGWGQPLLSPVQVDL